MKLYNIDPNVLYTETHAVTDDYGHRLYTVTTVQDCAVEAPPIEQCPLNHQVDYWSKAIHEAAQRLREISEQMQAVR